MISFPFGHPFSVIQGSIRKPSEKTVNSKDQVYGAAVWSPEPSVKESRVQV